MAIAFYLNSHAQNYAISLTNVLTGLTHPLYVTHAGDERLFVVEKTGLIKVFQPNATTGTVFLDISALTKYNGTTNSEQGLLGMAFHPDYKNNGYFYVNYTRKAPVNDGATVIARYRVSAADSNVADPLSAHEILVIAQPYSNHNGGCIKFGPDGYLYIGMGDGGSANDPQNYAQNNQSLLGKMLRIDVNAGTTYDIPVSNPFYGHPNIRNEIWANGLRNPWRFSFDRLTHDLWIADVGQNAREEINFQPASSPGGENYGWKCYEGTNFVASNCAVAPVGTVMPVYEYSHNAAGGYCVTGGYVYRSAKHKNLWGRYFFADAVNQHLWIITYDGSSFTTTKVMNGTAGSSNVSFGENVYGDLYLVKHASGIVQKISDTHIKQPHAFLLNTQSSYTLCEGDSVIMQALFHPDLTYQWRLNGQPVPGAQSAVFYAKASGNYDVYVTDPTISNAFPDSSSEIQVIVIPAAINALNPKYYTADINDAPFQINVTIPNGTFTGLGIDSNGLFTPVSAGLGTHQIIYTITTNGCPQRDTAYIEVTQTVNTVALVADNIQIFPNPTNGIFQIVSPAAIQKIEITDLMGKTIWTAQPNHHVATVSVQSLPKGIYIIKANTKTGLVQKRVAVE
jgi:glucose/arabinose dehydrogenase